MKRLLAFFLAICLCLSGVITAAPQASAEMTLGDPGQENSWRYSDGELLPADELESGVMPMAAYPSDKTAFGVDVSEHQGQIDWDTVASQIDFAIIRCGYGQDQAGQMDEWFIYNVQACERLGIPYGIYHYAYAKTSERAAGEADHALRLVNTYCGAMFKLPLYYDMEESSIISGKTASQIYEQAAAFCDKISAAGYKTGIYANTNWWSNYLTDSRFNQKVNAGTWHRWVAQYASSCQYNGTYQIWQYTSSETVNGISGRVDGNYMLVDPSFYGIGSGNTPVGAVLSTNKDTYGYNEAILITASTAYADSWVSLYPKGASTSGTSLYWYNLDFGGSDIYNGKTVNLLNPYNDTTHWAKNQNDTYMDSWGGMKPGTYVVYVQKGDYQVVASKEITITASTPGTSLSTDKDVYSVGEHIYVTASHPGDYAWVGLYPGEAQESYGSTASWFWYYTFNTNGGPVDIFYQYQEWTDPEQHWPVPAGTYTLALFSDSGYNLVTTKTITIVDPNNATVSTDKSTYCLNNDILVTTNFVSEGAWIGLYKSGDTYGSSGVPAINWYYVSDAGMSGVSILDHAGDRASEFGAGTYKVILFKDAGYTEIASTTITVNACADGNKDHKCDTCGATLSSCADGNNDHKCDVCGKTLSSCADGNNDHKCDKCGKTLTECADGNNDHKCDKCGKTLTECADGNNDHKCDKCGKTLSDCSDAEGDGDHDCDICGKEDVTDCSDSTTDKDHNCDECGKENMNACVDTNPADHKCDVCGAALSECSDAEGDGDHDCDHCGKGDVTDCSDENGDNKCDECGSTICEHVDTDPADHKCDKCGKTLSDCSDAEGDGDHDCDHCGKEDVTDCSDENGDNKCDECGSTICEHVDTDPADHKCDVCGATLSECSDAEGDGDHDCDHCGKEDVTDCADGNGDNKCDECGSTICEHVDTDPADHKCDKCGKVLSECADTDKNHKCDTCGAELTECADENKDHKCDLCDEVLSECADENKDHKCDLCDKVLSECVDEDKDYKCDICGKDLEKPEDPSEPVEEDEVIRLAGSHRWETALKVADEMKANLGVEKFDSIIIASGNDFADALAGSYLSTVKNAPILLGWGKGGKFEYLDTDNIAYIKANLAEGGTVYILGGKNAVPELYEDALKGYNVKRLGGANRFETNLLILAEAGVKDGSEILVCTSTNFADSLSASATAKPILLVFNEYGKLYGKQPEFLTGLKNCTFTVIGGESAVSADLAKAIEAYGAVSRLAGANRFETSVMVAQKYFKDVDTAVLAYAWNYPDGLCGGSLAYSLKAPLILTMTKYEAKAVEYAKAAGIETGLVLGGETLISDEAVRSIFAMDAADEIIEK